MSSEIARREGQPLIPNTSGSLDDARTNLLNLVNHYNPVQCLNSYRNALNYIENAGSKDHFFLLHLKPRKNSLLISAFRKNASMLANEQYLDIEKGIAANSNEEAVLLSVDSIAPLKKAYPNYFLDTRVFGSEVERVVGWLVETRLFVYRHCRTQDSTNVDAARWSRWDPDIDPSGELAVRTLLRMAE